MALHVKTIDNLSTVTDPTALNSKNFLLLSKIDTYNGESDATYEIYKVSDKVLLRGQMPTIVDAGILINEIEKIYHNFQQLCAVMQDRSDMLSEVSGYMLVSEVANDIARMLRQEDLKDVTNEYVETNELCAVASELYAKGEELAHEVMDYVGALDMAVVTAHGTAMAPATSAETPTEGG